MRWPARAAAPLFSLESVDLGSDAVVERSRAIDHNVSPGWTT
jgi:hypothetical protein